MDMFSIGDCSKNNVTQFYEDDAIPIQVDRNHPMLSVWGETNVNHLNGTTVYDILVVFILCNLCF